MLRAGARSLNNQRHDSLSLTARSSLWRAHRSAIRERRQPTVLEKARPGKLDRTPMRTTTTPRAKRPPASNIAYDLPRSVASSWIGLTDGDLLFQACHLVSQMPLVPLEVFGSHEIGETEVMKLSGCEIEERDLIRQAIRNLKGPSKYRTKYGQYRWALVRDAFGVGSGVANALCREFGFDPEEMIRS